MGDSRATVKIEFSIYGKDFKQRWWINWSPFGTDERIDDRIADWFDECYRSARADFDAANHEADRERREREAEREERSTLERLKAKYEKPP